ncbi:MAG: tape measure protein [Sarcina sp.]
MNLFSLMAKISIDDKNFNSGVDKSEKKFSGFGKTVTGVIAGLGIGKLAKDTIKLGIDTNAMAETSGIAWTTLLGSQEKSKKMLDDIAKFAATTPFEKMGVDNMAKQLHNAGLSGDDLFKQLTKFGDIGGAFGIQSASLEEMVRQYSQVQQAGVAYTEDLNILQDRGVPIYKALSETLGISTADVKKWASEGKISAEVYQEALDNVAKGVEGGMAAQSKSFSGMVSTFKDGMSELAGILAKPIFDGIKQALEIIQPKLDTFIQVLGAEGFGAALDSITPGLSDFVKYAGLIASALLGALTAMKLFAAYTAFVTFITGIVTAVKTFVGAAKAATLAQTLWNMVLLANPIGLVIAAIGLLVGAFVYLWTTSEEFRNFWINLWETVKTVCINAWEGLKTFFSVTIPSIIESISNWFSELPGKIKKWFDATIGKAIEWANGMLQKAAQASRGFISKVIEFFQQLPMKVWNWLLNTINKAAQWAKDMGDKAKEGAKNMVDNVVNGIKELPNKVMEAGKNIVKGLWNGISGMGGWLYDKVKGFATGILDNMKEALGIHSPSREAKKQIGQWIPPGIGEGIEGAMPKLDSLLQTNMDSLVGDVNINKSKTIPSLFSSNNSVRNGINPINLTIDNFYNNTDKDIEQLADDLLYYIQKQNIGVGTLG